MKNRFIAFCIVITIVATARAVAQSTNSPTPRLPVPAINQHEYFERLRSFSAATNLSDAETSALFNGALKTNAAAQLWARSHVSLDEGARAANVAQVLRVLASLREGNTNKAIGSLEAMLDSELYMLQIDLTLGESEPVLKFEPRARDLQVLRDARDYRLKYRRKSQDANMEAGVQRAFSILEKN